MIRVGLSAMAAVNSILGSGIAADELRTHEFLGPRRVGGRSRAGYDARWWPAAEGDSGARLRLWLLTVRDAADDIVSSSGGSASGAASGVTVSSSRSAAVSAEAVSGSTRARSASFQVKVTNLAVAQVNEGGELTSAATNSVQAGTNTFTIKVGTGAATTVSFTNDSTDTYAETLENLATTINDADAGVTASVVEDEDQGTVQLVLTAGARGLGSAFAVADVTGNVVSTVGFGSATTAAENAEFSVNGVPKSSQSNTVLIDRGRVQLTFKAETGPTGDDDEPGALISVGPDSLADAVLRLASSLNNLRVLVQADGSAHARRIQGTLGELLAGREADLRGIGITRAGNGQLNVNRDAFETAIANSRQTVSNLLGGTNGLAAGLSAAASTVLQGSRVRAQHSELVGSGPLPSASPLVAPFRDASRGLLVDVLG